MIFFTGCKVSVLISIMFRYSQSECSFNRGVVKLVESLSLSGRPYILPELRTVSKTTLGRLTTCCHDRISLMPRAGLVSGWTGYDGIGMAVYGV